jgi:hypothetical protein
MRELVSSTTDITGLPQVDVPSGSPEGAGSGSEGSGSGSEGSASEGSEGSGSDASPLRSAKGSSFRADAY